jgi:hypothetical protein
MAEDEEPFDASFLKDLADIIKNKTLFFIPFFGALLAFLFTKADYIKGSNAVIWVLLVVLFSRASDTSSSSHSCCWRNSLSRRGSDPRVSRGPASRRRRERARSLPCQIHPSSYGRCGKRCLGFDQSLMFKLGPEFGGNFALQRIAVLGDLLMTARPNDKSDRDIWRCRDLKRSGA